MKSSPAACPDEYRVLILPACYALSDIEAERIADFCRRGGTVIADFACGLFDQHGKGRARGALDELFGVRHEGTERRDDFFSGKLVGRDGSGRGLLVAVTWRERFATLDCRLEGGFAVAERRCRMRSVRASRARHGRLSRTSRRNAIFSTAKKARPLKPIARYSGACAGGGEPLCQVTSDGMRPPNCEVTYWTQGERTFAFVVQKAATGGGPLGGNWAQGLVDREIPLAVEFREPVRDVVDERAATPLGDGRMFRLPFRTCEAVMLSFRAPVDRPAE